MAYCETMGCEYYGKTMLFIDPQGYKIRLCPDCYLERNKRIYGEEKEDTKSKMQIFKDIEYDYFAGEAYE